MEFSNRISASSSSTNSNGGASTADETEKIVYTIKQDNVLFKQAKQPPSTITKVQIT